MDYLISFGPPRSYPNREEVKDTGTERLRDRLVDRWRSEGSDRDGSLEIFPSVVNP